MFDWIKLCSVTLECPNAGELAQFYAGITGGKATFLNDSWATVMGPGGRIDLSRAYQTSVEADPSRSK